MKKELIIPFVFSAAVIIAAYLAGMTIGSEMNLALLFLGFAVAEIKKISGMKPGLIALAAASAVSLIFVFPLNKAGIVPCVTSVLFYISMYVFITPVAAFIESLKKRENDLKSREDLLKRMKATSIERARSEDDRIDSQIRSITAVYNAVKDLSGTIKGEESIENIIEVFKKIVKNNFKLPLDDISFIFVYKADNSAKFGIKHFFGLDEEMVRDKEQVLTARIIKAVSKGREIVYAKKSEDEMSLGVFKSLVYMPFYTDNRLHGVFFVASTVENLFDEHQFENLKILTNQIAITLEKVHLYGEVERMSQTDSLTGLYVHRHFQEKLETELKRTQRYGGNLSLVMCDIDYFKKINDTHGHLAGDYILKSMAVMLKSGTSPVDIVARYGGEEFVIVMPETEKDAAHLRAVNIRKEIEKHSFVFQGVQIKVTMSMGVASFPADGMSRRSLIERADKALYTAKEQGRNRVVKAL